MVNIARKKKTKKNKKSSDPSIAEVSNINWHMDVFAIFRVESGSEFCVFELKTDDQNYNIQVIKTLCIC